MCFTWDEDNKHKSRCFVVAIVSLVVNTLQLLLSTIVLIQTKDSSLCGPIEDPHRLCYIFTEYFGRYEVVLIDTIASVGGVIGTLGIVASLILIFGLRSEKPGYFAVYICYGLQAIIVFLLITLFAFLRSFWWVGACTLIIFVANIYGLIVVMKVYDTITYTIHNQRLQTTSDVQLLIED